MTDTTPHEGAAADRDWRGSSLADSARLLLVVMILVGLAILLIGATHQPGCGGG